MSHCLFYAVVKILENVSVDHTNICIMASALSMTEGVDKLPKDGKAGVEIVRLMLDEIICKYTSSLKESDDRINNLDLFLNKY